MTSRPDLNAFSPEQLRALATELFDHWESKDRAIHHRDAVIEKQAHELALLKRHQFARRSEQFKGVQGQLLEELIGADLAAMETELAELRPAEAPTAPPKQQPKRATAAPTAPHPDPP